MNVEMSSSIDLVTLSERPDLCFAASELNARCWPMFLLQSKVGDEIENVISKQLLSDFQLLALQFAGTASEKVIGIARSLPFPGLHYSNVDEALPYKGWDAVISHVSGLCNDHVDAADWLNDVSVGCATSVIVAPEMRGTGLAGRLIAGLAAIAESKGYKALVVPVRPTLRSLYPLQSFAEYAAWTRPDGLPFDPWIRTHVRLGGRIVKVAPHAVTIDGSVMDWSAWTGLTFPCSGHYWIPGGVGPLHISVETGQGRYIEPNLWVLHSLCSSL